MPAHIALLIPVFNVEKTIVTVLNQLSSTDLNTISEVIIIDNSSTDQTVKAILDFAKTSSPVAKKIRLLMHVKNYGYGSSIKTGFSYITSKDFSHVIILHGDAQENVGIILKNFFDVLKREPDADIVLASRFHPLANISNYNFKRKLGNHFFNTLTRVASGFKMSDAGTAIICAKNSLVKTLPFQGFSSGWQFHPEMNLALYSLPQLKIREIPLNWSDSEVPSSIKLFQYGFKLLFIIFRFSLLKRILNKPIDSIFPIQQHPQERQLTLLLEP